MHCSSSSDNNSTSSSSEDDSSEDDSSEDDSSEEETTIDPKKKLKLSPQELFLLPAELWKIVFSFMLMDLVRDVGQVYKDMMSIIAVSKKMRPVVLMVGLKSLSEACPSLPVAVKSKMILDPTVYKNFQLQNVLRDLGLQSSGAKSTLCWRLQKAFGFRTHQSVETNIHMQTPLNVTRTLVCAETGSPEDLTTLVKLVQKSNHRTIYNKGMSLHELRQKLHTRKIGTVGQLQISIAKMSKSQQKWFRKYKCDKCHKLNAHFHCFEWKCIRCCKSKLCKVHHPDTADKYKVTRHFGGSLFNSTQALKEFAKEL
jgi:hypothetical protein